MEGKFSFIQKQLEASERLYEIMKNDLRDRTQHQLKYFELMTETTHSLILKLDGRDKEIKELKKGRIKIHICETCHGNGYVRVAKIDGDPALDFRDRSEVHQCWDCDSEGEYYETISDDLIDDGNSNKLH